MSATTQPNAQSPQSTETMPPSGPRPRLPISVPTPAPVQPGLSLPQDFPPLAAPQPPTFVPPKLQKKTTAPSTSASVFNPTVPPSQSAKGAATSSAKGKVQESPVTKEDLPLKPVSTAAIGSMPKTRPKKETATSGTVAPSRGKKNGKSGEPTATADGPLAESSKKPEGATGQSQKTSAKRHPGVLDLDTTKPASEDITSRNNDQSAEAVPASSTSASTFSQPQTPGTGVSQTSGASTAKGSQPRTFRVLPTSISASKSEASRKGPAAMVSKETVTTTSAQAPSRRGSLSSMNLPGTPASERISDNVSLTSTSMSRANSPPSGKVGTATTRHVSKSQQKKERQTRAKQAEEAAKVEEVQVKAAPEEPVQAPIIGRKKKQKKTAKGGTADSTPAVTRPGSPVPHEANVTEQEKTTPVTPVKDFKKDEAKATAESEAETAFSPTRQPTGSDQQQKNTLNAAALFTALQRSGDISSTAPDIFKPVMGINHRFDTDIQSLESMPEVGTLPKLTESQSRELERGGPVCVDQANNKRVIVLPDRRTLRGLTPEQANRYLQLRKQALKTSEGLFLLGHGPAPPRPLEEDSADNEGGKHLPNPFLTEAQTQSASASVSKLPQAFGSITGANPTTYVDEAAAFIATRRSAGSVMGIEEAEKNLSTSRRETETLEKKLNGLLKRNKRLIT